MDRINGHFPLGAISGQKLNIYLLLWSTVDKRTDVYRYSRVSLVVLEKDFIKIACGMRIFATM